MALIGYARVSTDEQTTDPQVAALTAVGCVIIMREHASGGDRTRPVLKQAVRRCVPGDVLVVVRIDRLARSLVHLLRVIEELDCRGAYFRSLGDPIDTSSPQGRFTLQILGAVAEFERALITERTLAGLRSARRRGRIGGNPGLRVGNPIAILETHLAREAKRDQNILEIAGEIVPTIASLRPNYPWDAVARALTNNDSFRPDGGAWTGPAVARAAKRLVVHNRLNKQVLDRTPRRRDSDDLVTLVAMATTTLASPTLKNIAEHLESLYIRTPRGGHKWSMSSVQNLLRRAVRQGLVAQHPLGNEGANRRGRPAKVL